MKPRTKPKAKRKRGVPHKKCVLKAARKSAPATINDFTWYTDVSYYTVRLSYAQGETAGLTLFNATKCVTLDDDHRAPTDEDSYESDRLYETYDHEINNGKYSRRTSSFSDDESNAPVPQKMFLSSKSPVFVYTKLLIDAAVSGEIDNCDLSSMTNSNYAVLDAMIDWGKLNLPPLSSTTSFGDLSDESLRFALTGAMAPYDMVKQIHYSDPTLCIERDRQVDYYKTLSCNDKPWKEVMNILDDPGSYPLHLTLKREHEPPTKLSEDTPRKRLKLIDSNVTNEVKDKHRREEKKNGDSEICVEDCSLEADDILSILPENLIAVTDPNPKLRFQYGDFVSTPYGPGKILSSRIDRYTSEKSDCGSTLCDPIMMYCVDLNFGTCYIPSRKVKRRKKGLPYTDLKGYVDHLKRCCWKREMTTILDNVGEKGDFCIAKDLTDEMPYLSPLVHVKGMDEILAFPLLSSQAKDLQSVSEKFVFEGSGLRSEIRATEVNFHDYDKWHNFVQKIAKDCASALGVELDQQKNMEANFSKILLLQAGHGTNQHQMNHESGLFGKMIIQLPSRHTGGSIDVEFEGVKKTFDSSEFSDKQVSVVAFYSDCSHQMNPIGKGWKLCLEYDLISSCSRLSDVFPSASSLNLRMDHLLALASTWNDNFDHVLGYLLEHDYKGGSLSKNKLKFANLKQRDKAIVNLIQSCQDKESNNIFSVCLALLQDEDNDEDEDGPIQCFDDQNMKGLELVFLKDYLLTTDDEKKCMFHKHKPLVESWVEEEDMGYDINQESEYRYRAAVFFWPKAMNVEVLSSPQNDGMLSLYSRRASKKTMLEVGLQVIQLLESKKRLMSTDMLHLLYKAENEVMIISALKCCERIVDAKFASLLAKVLNSYTSEEIKVEVLNLVRRTSAAKNTGQKNTPLHMSIKFLSRLGEAHPFAAQMRECLISGAMENIVEIVKMKLSLPELKNIALKNGKHTYESFYSAYKKSKKTEQQALTMSVGKTENWRH